MKFENCKAASSEIQVEGMRSVTSVRDAARLFYECDKRSRNCFACPVKEQCNWSEEEKNMEIKI